MMMTREIFEAIIGEKFSDEPVSEETLREIERLRPSAARSSTPSGSRTRYGFPGSRKFKMG